MAGFSNSFSSRQTPRTVVDPYNENQAQGRWNGTRMVPKVGMVGEHPAGAAPVSPQEQHGSLLPQVQWDSAFPNAPGAPQRIAAQAAKDAADNAQRKAAGQPEIQPLIDPFRESFPTPPTSNVRQNVPRGTAPAPQSKGPVDPFSGMPRDRDTIVTPYGTVAPIHTAFHQDQSAMLAMVRRNPQLGIAGSAANAAFAKGYNSHGDPERAFSESLNAARAPSPAGAHDDLNGANPLPGMFNEPAYTGPNEAPPVGGFSAPPQQETQQQNPQSTAQAQPVKQRPQINPTSSPAPAFAHNDLNSGTATPRATHAELADQENRLPQVDYHANPASDPLGATRVGQFLNAPFQSQNYPSRPAIRPLDPSAYADPETNPVALGIKRVGDALKSPWYRTPKTVNPYSM